MQPFDLALRILSRQCLQATHRVLVQAQRAQRAQHVNLLLHRVLTAVLHKLDAALFSKAIGGELLAIDAQLWLLLFSFVGRCQPACNVAWRDTQEMSRTTAHLLARTPVPKPHHHMVPVSIHIRQWHCSAGEDEAGFEFQDRRSGVEQEPELHIKDQ